LLPIARLRLIAQVLRHPCAILLFAQLAGLLLYPFLENRAGGNTLVGAFGVLVLVLAVRMVRRASGRWWFASAIALLALVLGALADFAHLSFLLPWSAACEGFFYFYAAYKLVGYMLADRRATTDELYAAGATFTLLAWAFAYVFVVCQYALPHSFGAAANADAPRTWTELLFLSFVLLSSTGIGDVTPLVPFARALACLEIFVGVMYLALIVSRLIGLTLIERDR
jgi:hypothetical protein